MNPISVHHLATTTSGGAGTALKRLDTALETETDIASRVSSQYESKTSLGYLRYALNHVPIAHRLLTDQCDRKFTPTWIPSGAGDNDDFDITHLHWVAGSLSPRSIKKIDGPIVWTIHDMWPLTGGCHHAQECDKFTRGCGQCPAIGSNRERDISHRQFESYRAALSGRDVHLIAPSEWIAKQAERSALVDGPIDVIPNCLDTELFSPQDPAKAREELSIPQDSNVVLTGGVGLDGSRTKGGDLLVDALANLKDHVDPAETVVIQFGNETINDLPFESRSLGWLETEQLPLVYSSADVMAVPSRYESFGQTAAESSACGTPVVAFDTSGIRDVVLDGKTGLLAECYDSEQFATCIEELFTNSGKAAAFGKAARGHAVQSWSFATVGRQHRSLYQDVR